MYSYMYLLNRPACLCYTFLHFFFYCKCTSDLGVLSKSFQMVKVYDMHVVSINDIIIYTNVLAWIYFLMSNDLSVPQSPSVDSFTCEVSSGDTCSIPLAKGV